MTTRHPSPPADVDLLLDLHPPRSPRHVHGHGGGRAVLVVDSIAIARKFLMQRLDRLGYRAHGAEHGDEALARAAAEPLAVVFCELALRSGDGLDGLGLCRAIRHQQRGPDAARATPAFVIVTGQLGASDRVRGALAGCDAYLTKPLDEGALLAVLRAVDPAFR